MTGEKTFKFRADRRMEVLGVGEVFVGRAPIALDGVDLSVQWTISLGPVTMRHDIVDIIGPPGQDRIEAGDAITVLTA